MRPGFTILCLLCLTLSFAGAFATAVYFFYTAPFILTVINGISAADKLTGKGPLFMAYVLILSIFSLITMCCGTLCLMYVCKTVTALVYGGKSGAIALNMRELYI
ncbi:hypothetical protein [Singapore grouper iridovirus]|nr:hypothetical protein [Singapore grouper iridovirus]